MKIFNSTMLCILVIFILFFLGCSNCDKPAEKTAEITATNGISYPYKATYSSDMSMSGNPENLRKVLTVWKMFETNRFDSMKKYYADTVIYESAGGHRFHGSSAALLAYAKQDVDGLDSMRFDISMWQNIHVNDRNEDWVFIWAAERRYSKDGTADTSLMHEQWKLKDGKIVYFNQYLSKPER